MRILAIIGQKDGNGKTSMAPALAVAGVQAGQSVALIDLDTYISKRLSQRKERAA